MCIYSAYRLINIVRQEHNMSTKSTKEVYLRDLDLIKFTNNSSLNPGSIYYKVYGVYPDKYFSHDNYDFEKIQDYFVSDLSVDSRNIIVSKAYFKKGEVNVVFMLVKLPNDMLFMFNFDAHNGPTTSICYKSESEIKQKDELIEKLEELTKEKPKNSLYILSKEFGGFGFKPFALDGKKLDLDINKHYNDDFAEVDVRIRSCITENENGLVLLHGKPGTGKTSYLKNLVKNSERDVIYIPAEMVKSIGSPGLIDCLFGKKGAVLFVEDAEEALLERNSGGSDSAAVSTLLNITDGFLADVLQLTVFCTFNSRYDQIDHALTRKGRILVKYEFKELCASKVSDIIGDSLDDSDIGKEMTIAEAFNYEAPHYNKQAGRIGF